MDFLFDTPSTPAGESTLVLAHGAGAPMDSPFMGEIASLIADRGWKVARFEFPYMASRRTGGKKRPPDRAPILEETWENVITELGGAEHLVIGGKSMGGRIASMVSDRLEAAGLVCLGYPFHPPGKPEKTRTEHLLGLKTPALICQGTRDPFGTRDDVAGYALSKSIRMHWAEDGNHDLAPRKASGLTHAENLEGCADEIAGFMASING